MHASTILAVLFSSLVAASPVALVQRQSDGSTCGDNYYSDSQLSDAANAAYSYYSSESEAGGSTYPHTYKSYEGFSFPVSGPYQEFPILESGVYDGGSPGADRVIINTSGEYAGSVTHTGASGNNFVGCSDTS